MEELKDELNKYKAEYYKLKEKMQKFQQDLGGLLASSLNAGSDSESEEAGSEKEKSRGKGKSRLVAVAVTRAVYDE